MGAINSKKMNLTTGSVEIKVKNNEIEQKERPISKTASGK
jgi:hypothetical protein